MKKISFFLIFYLTIKKTFIILKRFSNIFNYLSQAIITASPLFLVTNQIIVYD